MSNDFYTRIEDYLTGELPPEERQAFEREVAQNEELARELAQHRLEHQAMRMLLHDELRAKMSGWSKDENTEEAPTEARVVPLQRRARLRRLLSAAAALLLLVAAGTSWWANQTYGDRALARTYAQGLSTSQRGGPAREAESLLKAGDPAGAIALLRNATDLTDRLLLAQAYFQQGDFAAARGIYAAINTNEEASQTQRQLAEWQLALTHLAEGDTATAEESITAMAATSGHDYQQEAQKLRDRIQSGWRRLVW